MVTVNVEEHLENLRELNGIEPFDEKMTFYYDESGNCRKFSLTEKGFNSLDALKGDFVLAGVAYVGKEYNIDIQSLYESLEYQKEQKELKFKHLYHNSSDFLSFIGSKRASLFLKWLNKSGLYLHYSALNNLFYSLADIVDSLWETNPMCVRYFWYIKSALYDFVNEHQDEVIGILRQHTYPDVKNVSLFCNELCNLIKAYNNDEILYPGFYLELFRQMLKTAGKLEKMVFIQDNEPYMLIKEYYIFYSERCEIFSDSNHIFDEEPDVRSKLEKICFCKNKVPFKNWKFVESHTDIFVQISDLIAGLLRKMFMFLDQISMDNIRSVANELNDNQIKNFQIILSLIHKSNDKTKLMIKNANTPKNIYEREMKLNMLAYVNIK